MNRYFADMHIHIGADSDDSPVKITASKKLNFNNIAIESLERKGLDMVGIIDSASPLVIKDIERALKSGEMHEDSEGGIRYNERLVILLGAELESREKNGGQAHYLSFFPYLDSIKEFSEIISEYITNINLSTQSTGLSGSEIFQIVKACNGIFIPAHVFTPHKSFYGNCFNTYSEIFTEKEWHDIPAIELGLSADTEMADRLLELHDKTFLSNSDAHSLPKIAREYNILEMKKLNFKEFVLALKRKDKRRVYANYGLNPGLGKYHRTYCMDCDKSFDLDYPVLKCPECGGNNLVIGVKDRILQISKLNKSLKVEHRPEYIHQVPLLNIPGIGKKTHERLLEKYGTEMNVLHNADIDDLKDDFGKKIALNIIKARKGKQNIIAGGGGKYGKVMG